jgi:hypothetical protein
MVWLIKTKTGDSPFTTKVAKELLLNNGTIM